MMSSPTPNIRKCSNNFGNMASQSSECEICSAPAVACKQYGAVCCFSCRAFFRRSISRQYECVTGLNNCKVDIVTRTNCKKCRLDRCLQSGMRPELVDATVKSKQPEKSNRPNSSSDFETTSKCDILGGSTRNGQLLNVLAASNNCVSVIQQTSYAQNGKTSQLRNISSNNGEQDEKCLTETVTENYEDKTNDVDIERIAEDCYEDEEKRGLKNITNSTSLNSKIESNSKIGTLLPFKKRRTEHYNGVLVKICDQPLLGFTFEEEFRLHKLIACREYVNEKTVMHMMRTDPAKVVASSDRFNADVKMGRKITFDDEFLDFFFQAGKHIACSIFPEVYEELKNIRKDIAYKCISNSFPATSVLLLASQEASKNKGLMEQEKFVGYSGPSLDPLYDQLPTEVQTRQGMGLEDYSLFISPWAQSLEDEQFFDTTVKRVAQLLGDDMKTTVLFQLMLLSSQPQVSPLVRNSGLKEVQADLVLLMYRYLALKLDNSEAADMVENLRGMVEKMHRCGHILTNRRIRLQQDT